MELPYPRTSKFYVPIEEALKGVEDDLSSPLHINLGPRGYNRGAHIQIRESDQHSFSAEWESRHPTRFSVRLRAAAAILYRLGFRGRFWVEHKRGMLTLHRS